MDPDQALRRRYVPKNPFALHFLAVRGTQTRMKRAALAQVQLCRRDGKTLRAEPLPQTFQLRPGAPDQCARSGELALDDKRLRDNFPGGITLRAHFFARI